MLLPLAAMGLFLLAINGWRSLLRSAWWMRPFTAILVMAAVAVPWYVAVGLRPTGNGRGSSSSISTCVRFSSRSKATAT